MNPTHKNASSQVSWALLTEGVVQARVDAHRLRLLLTRALSLVEASEAKEALWQMAGDLIQAIPDRLSEVELHLDRTAYALTLMGEDFLRSRLPLDARYRVDEGAQANPMVGPRTKDSSAARVAHRFLQGGAAAPTAEDYFFDNPQYREVRQFADSGAITNYPSAAAVAVRYMDNTELTVPEAVRDSHQAPFTPEENEETPGSHEFNTLSRFLINTEQTEGPGIPQCRDDIAKHPKLKLKGDLK